jgi:repressor LexA
MFCYNYIKLDQLVDGGYIERTNNVSRGIRLLKMPDGYRSASKPNWRIPKLGRIQAGEPIPIPASDFNLLDPESAFIDLPAEMLPPQLSELFALEVQGDSMVDAMINDGDLVIMRQTDIPKNGDMVAAWLKSDGETTLKYLFREDDRIRLQPANPAYQPLYVFADDIMIQGKVVLVIRQLPQ